MSGELGRLRIGVLEDEDELRGMICDALADDGHTPLPFASGEQFLSELSDVAGALEVLVVDVNLGGLDGFEAVRAARLIRADLPVVFVSGDLRPLMRATDPRQISLMKPFTRESLRQVLRALLG